MKKQVVVIHGGDTFENYEEYMDFLRNFEIDISYYTTKKSWKVWLRDALGEDYEVILPEMPNAINAQYEEWKLWFEKLFSFLEDEVVLVGHSLGASFLAKYLSENRFPKKINGLFLVSGVMDKDTQGYGLASFAIKEKLNPQTENVYLYHSNDDPVVPFSELEKFEKALPGSISRVFEDRKHFNQDQFPELANDIINL